MSVEEKIPDYVISAFNDEAVERLYGFNLDSRTMRMLEAESRYHQITVEELIRRIIKKHLDRL